MSEPSPAESPAAMALHFTELTLQLAELLLHEMHRSLVELGMGFAGELTISDAMDDLMNALFLGRVPSSWARLAWPSLRNLQAWLHDLSLRYLIGAFALQEIQRAKESSMFLSVHAPYRGRSPAAHSQRPASSPHRSETYRGRSSESQTLA